MRSFCKRHVKPSARLIIHSTLGGLFGWRTCLRSPFVLVNASKSPTNTLTFCLHTRNGNMKEVRFQVVSVKRKKARPETLYLIYAEGDGNGHHRVSGRLFTACTVWSRRYWGHFASTSSCVACRSNPSTNVSVSPPSISICLVDVINA